MVRNNLNTFLGVKISKLLKESFRKNLKKNVKAEFD